MDREYNINKLSKDSTEKTTLIKYNTSPWIPRCVYSSRSTEDLLVGFLNTNTCREGKVLRYNSSGKHIQTIQFHNKTGQRLYDSPEYITENRNGDVIVSDFGDLAVVVTDRRGGFRFSCKESPKGSKLCPWGICTDALSNILVCDIYSSTIHIFDKHGHFLAHLPTLDGIERPLDLNYDDNTHTIWVGSFNNNTVNIYRVICGNFPTEDMQCTNHPTKPSEKYCADCDLSLCEYCIDSKEHSGHEITEIHRKGGAMHSW
ncbi:RING finger protein nhl-1-like [Saccostrea cucullata]|uniref:RING finger protein nhl-1-like n=1 Tax=Saccostrea cuccullata TaxID=36930 RepID=UPI002ED37920